MTHPQSLWSARLAMQSLASTDTEKEMPNRILRQPETPRGERQCAWPGSKGWPKRRLCKATKRDGTPCGRLAMTLYGRRSAAALGRKSCYD
jgi:hypothetical protein